MEQAELTADHPGWKVSFCLFVWEGSDGGRDSNVQHSVARNNLPDVHSAVVPPPIEGQKQAGIVLETTHIGRQTYVLETADEARCGTTQGTQRLGRSRGIRISTH